MRRNQNYTELEIRLFEETGQLPVRGRSTKSVVASLLRGVPSHGPWLRQVARWVESLAEDGELTPLQQSFSAHHALQCGYCTPGMLMSASALLEHNPRPTEDDVRLALQGNICRCTGYVNIVDAVVSAGSAAGH